MSINRAEQGWPDEQIEDYEELRMKTFMYRFIGSGNCYGPFKAANAKAARERVKELWADDFKTAGKRMRFELWESSQEFTGTADYHTQYAAE